MILGVEGHSKIRKQRIAKVKQIKREKRMRRKNTDNLDSIETILGLTAFFADVSSKKIQPKKDSPPPSPVVAKKVAKPRFTKPQ